jgi:hypothetical protein
MMIAASGCTALAGGVGSELGGTQYPPLVAQEVVSRTKVKL